MFVLAVAVGWTSTLAVAVGELSSSGWMDCAGLVVRSFSEVFGLLHSTSIISLCLGIPLWGKEQLCRTPGHSGWQQGSGSPGFSVRS